MSSQEQQGFADPTVSLALTCTSLDCAASVHLGVKRKPVLGRCSNCKTVLGRFWLADDDRFTEQLSAVRVAALGVILARELWVAWLPVLTAAKAAIAAMAEIGIALIAPQTAERLLASLGGVTAPTVILYGPDGERDRLYGVRDYESLATWVDDVLAQNHGAGFRTCPPATAMHVLAMCEQVLSCYKAKEESDEPTWLAHERSYDIANRLHIPLSDVTTAFRTRHLLAHPGQVIHIEEAMVALALFKHALDHLEGTPPPAYSPQRRR